MAISRRALLHGNLSSTSVHISSLVVHCRPEHVSNLINQLSEIPDVEVPEHSVQGKLVVLLETANESLLMERIRTIEKLVGVINTALVYHQIDNESGIAS